MSRENPRAVKETGQQEQKVFRFRGTVLRICNRVVWVRLKQAREGDVFGLC